MCHPDAWPCKVLTTRRRHLGQNVWLRLVTSCTRASWRRFRGRVNSNRKETSCVPLLKAGFESGAPDTYIHTYLLLLISMLWHRQAIFKSKGDKLCSSAECRIWTRGPRHQIASRLNARSQTDWAIEDQAKKLELDSPSLWSASIQPTWPHCQLTFVPGSGDIHVCCCC